MSPYASEKQRRYMESQEPEIAAKWRKKGHAYVKKNRGDWTKAIAAGTAAGALANQFPRIQDVERDRKRKKKGQIKKAYDVLVHSDDPEFNHAAAKKAFDLVMKMDDDSAQMFTLIAMSEMFETDITKNLRTLQGHLNEVIAKRLEAIGKATDASIAKGDHQDAEGYGKALAEITKAVVNPYISGRYQFEETDFRRDPHSGQFRSKIKHTQKTPFSNRVAAGMGLVPNDKGLKNRYSQLNSKQRAQYQDEYRQLAGFLNTVTQSSQGGDNNVMLRYEDRQGNEFMVPHTSTDPSDANKHLLNPNLKLISAEANPAGLTLGGAGFSLAQAMGAQGGQRTGQALQGVNIADEQLGNFSQAWLRSGDVDPARTNQKLYNRTFAAGKYIGEIAPQNSKTAAAAQLAQVVGSHGPEAEAVIGPTARRTAYRYRGTEKTPDKNIVSAYNMAIRSAKRTGPGSLVDEEELRQRYQGQGKPSVGEAGVGASRRATSIQGVDTPASTPAGFGESTSQAAARALAEARPPTWAERSQGRKVIVDWLGDPKRLPKKSLYELQTKAGNTPPSEGIILNSKGQVVTQAVGYGDDHYLPFNLKNLKALKGGEYVRTRSVGGLTSEDIYTGLISGARRVTVVSRSGTFSVEFEPDFRGGRRYNDKALRMTRRYEQILDAVQSKQVSRGEVPIEVQDALRAQVVKDYPYEKSRKALNTKYEQYLKEYRADPELGPQDENLLRFISNQIAEKDPSRTEVEYLNYAKNKVMEGKRINYQLDAQGYEAAQDSLAEQFPYYITSHPNVEIEPNKRSYEKDKGYVEPGRVLPTAAMGGLYGTVENEGEGQGEKMGERKFSQSQAGYQRGRIGRGKGDISPHIREPGTTTRGGRLVPSTPEAPAEGTGPGVIETTEEGTTEEGTTPATTTVPTGFTPGGAGTPAPASVPASVPAPERTAARTSADYLPPGGTRPAPEERTPATPTPATPDATPDATRTRPEPGSPASAQVSQARNENTHRDAAYELFAEMKTPGRILEGAEVRTTYGDILNLNDEEFVRSWDQNQSGFRDHFHALVTRLGTETAAMRSDPKVLAYNRARNAAVNRIPSGPGLVQYWSKEPQAFLGVGYQPTDTDEQRNTTVYLLDQKTRPITADSSLSELAEVPGGLEREHKILRGIHAELRANPGLSNPGAIDERNAAMQEIFGGSDPTPQAARLFTTASTDDLINAMGDVQRMRTIKSNYKGTWPFTVGGPKVAPGTPPEGYQVTPRREDGRPALKLVDPVAEERDTASAAAERHHNKNQVLDRLKVLRRWRQGLPTGSPVKTPGDDAVIAGEAMLKRFEPGRTPPTSQDVDDFLTETERAFAENPKATDQLRPGERHLFENDPDTFYTSFVLDDEGYWVHDRGDQESAE